MHALAKSAMDAGVLKKGVHDVFILRAKELTERAGIPEPWLFRSATEVLTKPEIKALKSYRKIKRDGTVTGLRLVPSKNHHVENRMQGITAMLLRNEIDARMMTLHRVMEELKGGGPEATVLLIPDLTISKKGQSGLSGPAISKFLSMLVERSVKGQFTIVYVNSMDDIHAEYGESMHDHIDRHYLAVGSKK